MADQTNHTDATKTVVRRVNPALGVPLDNLDDAMAMAKVLATSDLLPKALRGKAADTLIVMMYGQELGWSPIQAFRGINVVEGSPRISGEAWLVRLREKGHDYEIVEHTRDACTIKITRGDNGKVHTERFTLEDAADMGLCTITDDGKARARSQQGKALPWETATKRMLLWRAVGNGVSIHCPEVAFGFGVDDGSAPLVTEERPKPTLAEVAANRDKPAPTEPPAEAPPAAPSKAPGDDPADVVDAEFTDAPPPPSADELAEMAAAHSGASEPEDAAGEGDGDGLFGDTGWPDVTPPGGAR